MTRHLHIDAFSGVSGDMFLGALVDTGVPLSALEKGLKALRHQRLSASRTAGDPQ